MEARGADSVEGKKLMDARSAFVLSYSVGAGVRRLDPRTRRIGKMLGTAKIVDRFNGDVLPRVDTQHIIGQDAEPKKDTGGQK
jgi:hypothetical protein